jgi:two-component system sensor histidine kinase/response regulator
LAFPEDKKVPAVKIDTGLIKRVISNLLTNALRHTPVGGTITGMIDVNNGKGNIRIRIKDTGEGVPIAYHKKIFNKFEQVRLSRPCTSVGSGGLDLPFCKMAVEAHGGRIWIETPFNDKGSVFCFEIPVGNNTPFPASPGFPHSPSLSG